MPVWRSNVTYTMLCVRLAVGWACLNFGGLAFAQGIAGVTLHWNAPTDCSETDEVFSKARELLGEPGQSVQSATIEVRIRRLDEDLWRLHFETKGERTGGQRDLELRSCEEIRDAAAILIALALNPRPPASEPVAPPIAAESRPETPEESALEAKPEKLELGIGPAVLLDTGMLPNPTLGFGPRVALRIGSFRMQIAGTYFLPQSAPIAGRGGAKVSLELVAFGLQLSYLLAVSAFDLGPLISGELGYLGGEAVGVAHGKKDGLMWYAFEAGGTLGWRLRSWLCIRMDLVAVSPARRPEFALTDLGTVRRTPPIALRTGITTVVSLR